MNGKTLPDVKTAGQDRIRTFIAVKLPDHVIRTLSECQHALKKHGMRIKWSRPENIHLTLKFLGDIPAVQIEPVCQVISDAVMGFSPITLCAKGVGFFPGIRRARVLWTGISGQTDALEQLQKAIDAGLGTLGFAREERRYTGHLTLGRFKSFPDPEALLAVLKTHAEMASDEFLADAVHVYQSELKPLGPIYTNLHSIFLGK